LVFLAYRFLFLFLKENIKMSLFARQWEGELREKKYKISFNIIIFLLFFGYISIDG